MDVQENGGQEVIGYSPDCGYLIRGRRQDMGQLVALSRDDLAQVEVADAVDQQVFGVDGQHPVVVVVPRYSGNVRRYLGRYSWFKFGARHSVPERRRHT